MTVHQPHKRPGRDSHESKFLLDIWSFPRLPLFAAFAGGRSAREKLPAVDAVPVLRVGATA